MENLIKKCSKCRVEKLLKEFTFNKSCYDGRQYWCKECCKKSGAIYRSKNKEKVKKIRYVWDFKNKERKKQNSHNSYINNKDKEKFIERRRIWRDKNKDKIREYGRKYQKIIRGTSNGRLNHNVSTYMAKCLRRNKKGGHWESLVGYTIHDLRRHLEKRFLPGMTWDNYGKHGWHIDHKIPISAFNFDSPQHLDFKRCWALKNLRPLWAEENIGKHDNLDRPFQPSLKI